MSTNSWQQFRARLFELIDKKRALLLIFNFEVCYFFISDCARIFKEPGTAVAREALAQIQDDGTFLLVAKSFSAFRSMFDQGITDEDLEHDCSPDAPPVVQKVAPVSEAARPHSEAPAPGRHSPPQSPSVTDARHSSGHPFRR